jgi:hypothetical protein
VLTNKASKLNKISIEIGGRLERIWSKFGQSLIRFQ